MKRHNSCPRGRRQRGATAIEYALLVGAFCLCTSASLGFLETKAREEAVSTASAIGSPDAAPISGDSTGADDGDSAAPSAPAPPSTPSTTSTTSTTTPPPTTTSTTVPPTTTTSTTTTMPPTTTTAKPSTKTDWSANATKQNKNKWTSSATVTIYGTDGKPMNISMGVQIKVIQTYLTWDGKVQERTWDTSVNIDANGKAVVVNTDLNTGANGQEAVLAMTYEVTGVTYYWPTNPTIKWDGGTPSVKVDVPN